MISRLTHGLFLEYGDPVSLSAKKASIAFHWRIQPVINVAPDGRSARVRTYLFHPNTSKQGSSTLFGAMYPDDHLIWKTASGGCGTCRSMNLTLKCRTGKAAGLPPRTDRLRHKRSVRRVQHQRRPTPQLTPTLRLAPVDSSARRWSQNIDPMKIEVCQRGYSLQNLDP